jgi:hypothetical protein
VKVTGLVDTFDGGDLVVRVHDGEGEAGVDAATVNVDGACSALAVVAAFLGAGQGQVFAETVEEGGSGVESESVGLTVDLESYGYGALGEGFFRYGWCGGCRNRGCCEYGGRRGGESGGSKMREEGAAADAVGWRGFGGRSYGSRVGIGFGVNF